MGHGRTLQRQLTIFARTIFIGFVALLIIEQLYYWRFPQREPRDLHTVVLLGIASLAPFAIAWYALARRELTQRALHAIDLALMTATGAMLAANVWLTFDRVRIGYGYALCALVAAAARVLVVPSTRVRTMLASGLALGPLVVASIVLAVGAVP